MAFLTRANLDQYDIIIISICIGVILLTGFLLCIKAYKVLNRENDIAKKVERDRKLEKIYKNRRNKY